MRGWLALVVWLGACSAAGGQSPMHKASTRVAVGVSKGLAASSEQPPTTFQVRYNPAICACPPFEVFAYGRWMRVFIDPTAASTANLDALERGAALSVTKVSGRVGAKPRAADNGVLYPVVVGL